MRRILTLATLALALAAAASAQTAGRITGTIKDPDGKPIKGATVRATNDAVNAHITATTDDKGRFAMIGVRSGRWTIIAEAPNFLAMQGTSDVSSSNAPVLALTLQRDPGPMPGALSKTINEEVAAAEALSKAGRYDEAISAYQTIQSKNPRLTTVNRVLASLYRERAEQEKDPAAKQALLNRAADADNEFKKSESK
jgi:tetratricopeptide (TPR) repeat protein